MRADVLIDAAENEIQANWPDRGAHREAVPWTMVVQLILQVLPEVLEACGSGADAIRWRAESFPRYAHDRVFRFAYPAARDQVAARYSWIGRIFRAGRISREATALANHLAESLVISAAASDPDRLQEVIDAALGD